MIECMQVYLQSSWHDQRVRYNESGMGLEPQVDIQLPWLGVWGWHFMIAQLAVHVVNSKALFDTLRPENLIIQTANSEHSLLAEGVGSISVQCHHTFRSFTLDPVLFVPKLSANLLSVYQELENRNDF